ncbi:MAG: hypothetical protein AB7O50_15000 [Pseudolabrys sp.]
MPYLDRPYFSIAEALRIAERIERRAGSGRIVNLLPDTARLCAQGLRRSVTPPSREDIVRIVCGVKRCDHRNSCYSCIGKANAILSLLEREPPVP